MKTWKQCLCNWGDTSRAVKGNVNQCVEEKERCTAAIVFWRYECRVGRGGEMGGD